MPVCLRKNRVKCDGSENASRRKSRGSATGEHQLAFGFGQDTLADEMARRDAGRALDVVVKPVGGHCQLLGVEADQPLLAEMFVQQAAQFLDPRVGARQRHRARARAAHRQPHHLDGDQRQQPAHGEAIAFARQRRLLVEIGAERGETLSLVRIGERHHRIGRYRLEPRQRFARLVAECIGDVLGEAHHPAVGDLRGEAKTVRGGGRHQDRRRRRKRHGRRLEIHLAATLLDQQDLEQVAVTMRTDRPVVHRGARGDSFDMDEVERAIVRRIAVKMKQRERRRCHCVSIGEAAGQANAIELLQKKSPAMRRGFRARVAVRQRFCWLCWPP